MTAYAESANGLLTPRNGHTERMPAGFQAMMELYESRLGDLETQIAEQGWSRIDGSAGREFGRDALGRIVELARVMYLKNPIIRRAVEIGALYVWGQDLAINAADETVQETIDRFWKDNRATLTGQQASRLIEVELQVTGNLFLALFPDKVTGQVRVRGVPMEEIQQIITNPDDRTEVWYYRRTWNEPSVGTGTSAQKNALYPDWQYLPANKATSVEIAGHGNLEIRWDSPIMHVKSGAFAHWQWGVPEVYAALDWAKAYKEHLEDDATRSRALARFAWQLTTKGGARGVAAAKTRLNTTAGIGNAESNPPPLTGSTFIAGEGVDMSPIRVAGSTLDPEHSRPARLMASAALGIPDHFFDADVGNFATSKTLDRPTELRFSERRQMWKDKIGDLCQWVIDRDLEATRGLLPNTITEEQREVELSWPDLLEPDVVSRVQSVAVAAPFISEELASRLMMSALNVEDIDGELEKMAAEQATKPTAPTPPVPPTGGEPPVPPTESARIAEAKKLTADEIKRAIKVWDRDAPDGAGMIDAEVEGGPNAK